MIPEHAMVSPDSTFEEDGTQQQQQQQDDVMVVMSVLESGSSSSSSNRGSVLETLRWHWNMLDRWEEGGSFCSESQRRLCLRDMGTNRLGQEAYYSLGGEQRRKFAETFLQLSRRTQTSFWKCAKECLEEKRVMGVNDIDKVLQETRGKRKEDGDEGDDDDLIRQNYHHQHQQMSSYCQQQQQQHERPFKRGRTSYNL